MDIRVYRRKTSEAQNTEVLVRTNSNVASDTDITDPLTGLLPSIEYIYRICTVVDGVESAGVTVIAMQPADTSDPTKPVQLITVGDSLTFGTGSTSGNAYPDQLQTRLAGLSRTFTVSKFGYPGWRASQFITDEMQNVINTFDTVANEVIAVVWFGANDLANVDVPTAWANFQTIYTAFKDAGSKIIMLPVMNRMDLTGAAATNFNPRRLDMNNNNLYPNSATIANDIADLSLKPEVFADNAPLETFFFATDKVHLANNGYTVIAEMVARAAARVANVVRADQATPQKPNNALPVANAGADQTITAGNTLTLTGSGTDSDGTIASYAWSKVSGGAATITTPSAATTTVTGLVQGAYVFRLAVTDNSGGTATDDVSVTVNAASSNTAPTVVNPVADMSLSHGAEATTTINYASVFSDTDALTYSFTTSNAAVATVTMANGVLSVNPTTTKGTTTITVTATDTGGLTASDAFVLTVGPVFVDWGNLVNVTYTKDPNHVVRKVAGGVNVWDAGATANVLAGATSFIGERYRLGFTAQVSGGKVMLGFSDTVGNASYESIRYGIYRDATNISFFENGVSKFSIGSSSFGGFPALAELVVTDVAVELWVKGVKKYTSALAPTYPMYIDASIAGFTDLTEAYFQNVTVSGKNLIASGY